MKTISLFGFSFKVLFILTVCQLFAIALAQDSESKDSGKCLSPYFFVQSEDGATDQLPLKSTGADVNIAGVIADVHVTQVYENKGKSTIEAIYIFPASTRAAVYGLRMKIGERTIEAKIEEALEARQQYEAAKQNGQSASLLEQQRPNVFQMNVANILPGDVIHVDLFYTELLVPEEGTYEFVYPTVVGPRYSNTPTDVKNPVDAWIENPYLQEGESPTYDFDLQVNLDCGMPVSKIFSPSHKIGIAWQGKNQAAITLDSGQKQSGNQDFILRFQVSSQNIQSGLLLFEGEKENFFLAMIQPPEKIARNEILPREYIFIVDVSGSMNGYPLSISKEMLRDLIGNLKPTDKFNVLLFAGGSRLLEPVSVQANEDNITRAIRVIDNETGGGGTELLPALEKALTIPSQKEFARSIIILTDGYVSVEREAFELIRKGLNKANVFAFGIGTSVNRYLIEGLARAGMGESFVASKESEARNLSEKFRKYISTPVWARIKMQSGNNQLYDVEPASIPDLFARRPIMVYGKYRGKLDDNIRLSGINAGGDEYQVTIQAKDYKAKANNSALRYLWARNRIMMLSDYGKSDEDAKTEVTRLGLQYNLLTEYTSFLAIDSERRNSDGALVSVKQPLPLPTGVPLSAVGNRGYGLGRKASGIRLTGSAGLAPTLSAESTETIDSARVELGAVSCDNKNLVPMITATVSNHLDAIHYCYKKQLKNLNKPYRFGNLKIQLELDVNGKVKSAKLIEDQLKDADITDCVLARIRGWAFNPDQMSGPAGAVITLNFGI